MAAYDGCRASALASALQITPMAARALGLVNTFPGMTLHELSCILGGSHRCWTLWVTPKQLHQQMELIIGHELIDSER